LDHSPSLESLSFPSSVPTKNLKKREMYIYIFILQKENLNYLPIFPRRSARIFIIFIAIVSCSPGLVPPCGKTSDNAGLSDCF
jgi:hypothetical protein